MPSGAEEGPTAFHNKVKQPGVLRAIWEKGGEGSGRRREETKLVTCYDVNPSPRFPTSQRDSKCLVRQDFSGKSMKVLSSGIVLMETKQRRLV